MVETASTCTSGPVAALTTVFKVPTGCPSVARQYSNLQDYSAYSESCFIPSFSRYWFGACTSSNGYYSPGICQESYYAAATRWDDSQGPPPVPGENAWICCPFGYTTLTGVNSACMQGTANSAPGYQIRWKASDLSILATHPLTPTSPIGTRENPSLATATASSSSSPPSSNPALGTGPKAGIAIGVVLGVIILLLIGFLLWRRRRKTNKKSTSKLDSDEGGHDAPEVVLHHHVDPYAQKSWGSTVPIPELDSTQLPAMIDSAPPKIDREISSEKEVLVPESGLEVVTSIPTSPKKSDSASMENEKAQTAQQTKGELVPKLGLEVVEHNSKTISEETELAHLKEEQSRIQEERERLARLQELDQEEERIKRRMNELAGNKH